MNSQRNNPGRPTLLFTAFEPSGDEHAAAVIERLKERHPEIAIYAWGGPKMEAAGARVVERTGDDAVMGLPGLAKIREHKKINARVDQWLEKHPVTLHIPVDSPAANFPICKIAQKHGVRVVHLVAPQLWAWGAWRVKKLRRLTSLVLCLLPFEEAWFKARDVDARFVGHPLFDKPLNHERLRTDAADLPAGQPKIALLPGSRPGEIEKNFPLLLAAFSGVRRKFSGASAVIAATTEPVAQRLREIADANGGMPENAEIVVGRTDSALSWCDLALVVSGTVTLQVARHNKPMVIVYKSNPFMYALLGWWIIDTELFTLPNLIAGREIVPELVPHFGDEKAIVEAALALLESRERAEAQRRELRRVVDEFKGLSAGSAAADEIARVLGLEPTPD